MDLSERMKRYEAATSSVLPWRLPLIVRVDGKAFHTWTRGLRRPFDHTLMRAMDSVAVALCEEMQGARIAFVQSDEISVLLYPWTTREAEPWFGNNVQKIVSVAAGIASTTMTMLSPLVHGHPKPAVFDARVFALPESDVVNAFIWRQQDASRNSLQALAQSLYSQRQLHGKKHADLHEICVAKGQNWNDLRPGEKRGRCVRRDAEGPWIIDSEPPIFTADRAYIEGLMAWEAPERRTTA